MLVIGDVHGEFDALMRLMEILPQTKDICFVGDLIDRGPKSKEVIDFVIKNNYLTVMGNHEDLITDHSLWMSNGGYYTLQSFGGIDNFKKSGVIEWISELPVCIRYDKYLISHSYAYKGEDTPTHDLLWGRKFSMNAEGDFINIFGHTAVKKAIKIHKKHWDIDTGATYGNKLSAIDLDTEKIYFVDNKK